MIRFLIFNLSFIFLNSCISNPLKFYPPRRLQPHANQKTDMVPVSPPLSTPFAPANSSSKLPDVVSSQATTAVVIPALTPPPPPSAITAFDEQKDLLQSLKNPLAQKNRLLEAIENETSLNVLEKALELSRSIPQSYQYRPLLFFKAAELAQKNHKPDFAIQFYRALVSQYPQSPQALKANSEVSLIQAAEDVNSKVIGAILPLSGKNANIGQHALNSLRMGLGLTKPDSKFRLAIFDSQGSSELARLGVEKLVRDDKVIAIIGGLSSKEALSAGKKADSLGVPFIGLSQKSGLTSLGDYVFRNSLTAKMQVDRLLQFAFEKLGAKHFAILYPNDAYGVEFANIYWDHVLARGGQITAAQAYDSKENDFTAVVQKMVGTYYVEARPEEYAERLKELDVEKKERAEKNKNKVSRAHDVQENILPPIVDFDVLFIPDTGKSLGQVIAFMKVNDVTQMTYLGTNIWNSLDLGKRANIQNNKVFFVDALDLNDTSIRETPFFKDYLSEFNEEPTLIEMQVFESAKIIRDLILNGSTSRASLASELRGLGRVPGVTGELRMSSQRELERPLSVLSLEAEQIKKIE